MKFIYDLKLRAKLILSFVIVSIIPMVLITAINSTNSYNNVINASYQINQDLASDIASEMNTLVIERENMLKALASVPEVYNMNPNQQVGLLKSFVNANGDVSGMFITDLSGQQLSRDAGSLVNVKDRQYFKDILNGAEKTISDVIISKANGKAISIIAVPIKNSENQLVGMLACNLDLDNFKNKISEIKLGESGYAFITDKTGTVLAHPQKELIDNLTNYKELTPIAAALAGKTGLLKYDFEEKEYLAAYNVIAETGWAIVVQNLEAEAVAPAKKELLFSIVLLIITLIFIGVISYLVTKIIAEPLALMAEKAKIVASGDLSQVIDIDRADEVGELAKSFNNMIKELKALITHLQTSSEQLSAASEELTASSEQSAQTSIKIAENVSLIASNASEQMTASNEATNIIEGVATNIQKVAITTKNVADTTVVANNKAVEGRSSIEKAVQQMNNIKDSVAASAAKANILGEKSNQIGQIIDTIASIAGQTNLLALNAAIEAARAGEHGRGFAVVAEEVRKLAEQSQGAAHQITLLINHIQTEMSAVIKAMQDENVKAEQGAEIVKEAGGSFQEIAKLVVTAADQIKVVAENINIIADDSKLVVSNIENLDTMSKENNEKIHTISHSTETQAASVEEIASASHSLADLAEDLRAVINKFKL